MRCCYNKKCCCYNRLPLQSSCSFECFEVFQSGDISWFSKIVSIFHPPLTSEHAISSYCYATLAPLALFSAFVVQQHLPYHITANFRLFQSSLMTVATVAYSACTFNLRKIHWNSDTEISLLDYNFIWYFNTDQIRFHYRII